MNDNLLVVLRAVLMVAGGFLAGRGYVTSDQVSSFVAKLPEIIGAATSIGSMIWGIYVRWNTKSVSVKTGARPDVPTLSTATGTVEKS